MTTALVTHQYVVQMRWKKFLVCTNRIDDHRLISAVDKLKLGLATELSEPNRDF